MKTTTLKTLLRSALVVAVLGLLAGSASAQTTYNLVADEFSWSGTTPATPMWGFAPAGLCDVSLGRCASVADCTALVCAVGGNSCAGDTDCTALVCTYGGNSCAIDTDCVLTDTCDTLSGLCTLGGNACTGDIDCTANDLCDTPDPADLCNTPDPADVCSPDAGYLCGSLTSWAIGPRIDVDLAGASGNLTINLRNCLAEPVSILIPGQVATLSPVRAGDGGATSLTAVAAANGGTQTYTWTGIKPGTYLYHSGSNMAKQVQMGLYGGLIVDWDRAGGIAYPDNPKTLAIDPVTYDIDAIVVTSEIDPALHATAATAKPLNFKPKYFLVNGVADGSAVLSGVAVGDQVLLRLINAGLNSYVPNLLGEDLEWVAEDGNPYTYPKTSYSALLPAGKTLDAVWTPVTDGDHYLYDRRLHMSFDGEPGGGLIASINIGQTLLPIADAGPDQSDVQMFTPAPPTATTVTLNGSASLTALGVDCPTAGTCSYAWSFVGKPAGSLAALVGDTTVAPTFTLDEVGTYSVQLVVSEGGVASAADVVNIHTNHRPVAVASANLTAVEVGEPVQLTGSASYDQDLDAITHLWSVTGGTLSGSTINPTWNFTVPGTFTATLTVTESAGDLLASVPPATVQVTVSPAVNDPPVANPDFYQVTKNSTNNVFAVTINDDDPDGTLNLSTVTIVTPPTQGGTATVNAAGAILYSPKRGWRGTDYFTYTVRDNLGAVSNVASVVVNVVN